MSSRRRLEFHHWMSIGVFVLIILVGLMAFRERLNYIPPTPKIVMTGTIVDVKYVVRVAAGSLASAPVRHKHTELYFADGTVKVYNYLVDDVLLNRPVVIYKKGNRITIKGD